MDSICKDCNRPQTGTRRLTREEASGDGFCSAHEGSAYGQQDDCNKHRIIFLESKLKEIISNNEIHELFHKLWGNASAGIYDKKIWNSLQIELDNIKSIIKKI